jgi:hypothetical protein
MLRPSGRKLDLRKTPHRLRLKNDVIVIGVFQVILLSVNCSLMLSLSFLKRVRGLSLGRYRSGRYLGLASLSNQTPRHITHDQRKRLEGSIGSSLPFFSGIMPVKPNDLGIFYRKEEISQ